MDFYYEIRVKRKHDGIVQPIIFKNELDAHKFMGALCNNSFQIKNKIEVVEKFIRKLTKVNVDTNEKLLYNKEYFEGVSCEFLNSYLAKIDLKVDC